MLYFCVQIDWDDAIEVLDDGLQKIRQAVDQDSSNYFRQLFNQWFKKTAVQTNLDQLFLLIIGAFKKKTDFERIREVLEPRSKEFSLYLHNFNHLKRNHQDLSPILEFVAKHGGSKYRWIFFRIDRTLEGLKNYKNVEVSNAILETLKDIPEVLLGNQECASRVADYLVRCNDIDELIVNLRPTFAKDVKYKKLLDPLLLQHLLRRKTTFDDLKRIICSEFMKNAYQPAGDQNKPIEDAIITIFHHQKLSDVIRLALHTPVNLLPVVTPVVESNVSQKLEKISTFTNEEYNFLSDQFENDSLSRFPQVKQQIEVKLLKMAIDFVQPGYFQNVKSVKLILLALAEMRIPFLESPKFVNLQKALAELPQKFFQNLYAALNPLEKTLKPYRKGKTRTIVEKLENHFDHLDELFKRIQNREVVLNEFPWLKVW